MRAIRLKGGPLDGVKLAVTKGTPWCVNFSPKVIREATGQIVRQQAIYERAHLRHGRVQVYTYVKVAV